MRQLGYGSRMSTLEDLRREHSSTSRSNRVCHPLMCRLDETAAIDITNPISMTEVGFSCLAIGILTAFRPIFVILISVIPRIKPATTSLRNFQEIALPVCYIWFSIVLFVLFLIGIIPLFADKIRKRWILLIHPWALLVMYIDVAIWLTISVIMYINLETVSPHGKNLIRNVTHTQIFLLLIFIDIAAYFLVHHIFITYYIAAELTLIERFY